MQVIVVCVRVSTWGIILYPLGIHSACTIAHVMESIALKHYAHQAQPQFVSQIHPVPGPWTPFTNAAANSCTYLAAPQKHPQLTKRCLLLDHFPYSQ